MRTQLSVASYVSDFSFIVPSTTIKHLKHWAFLMYWLIRSPLQKQTNRVVQFTESLCFSKQIEFAALKLAMDRLTAQAQRFCKFRLPVCKNTTNKICCIRLRRQLLKTFFYRIGSLRLSILRHYCVNELYAMLVVPKYFDHPVIKENYILKYIKTKCKQIHNQRCYSLIIREKSMFMTDHSGCFMP